MNRINLIGLSGAGQVGKDSCYLILNKILKEYGIETDRIGLADPLKAELSDFTKNQYNINIFTKDIKEKEVLRPLMVAHGRIKRALTNGKYFTDIAQNRVIDNIKDGVLSIVTDIRYIFYSEDEVGWLKNNNGALVYIERVDASGILIPPANEDEEVNNKKIKAIADYTLLWPTTENLQIREDYIKVQLNSLIERIKNEYK